MQWGPNATTWLLPSELYPTEVRALAHGMSAAAGKFGALFAGIVFHHMSTPAIFKLSALCGLVGACVTMLFVPDVTTLDLTELDKRWASLCSGDDDEYTGPAVDPAHLSMWERWQRSSSGEHKATTPATAV